MFNALLNDDENVDDYVFNVWMRAEARRNIFFINFRHSLHHMQFMNSKASNRKDARTLHIDHYQHEERNNFYSLIECGQPCIGHSLFLCCLRYEFILSANEKWLVLPCRQKFIKKIGANQFWKFFFCNFSQNVFFLLYWVHVVYLKKSLLNQLFEICSNRSMHFILFLFKIKWCEHAVQNFHKSPMSILIMKVKEWKWMD